MATSKVSLADLLVRIKQYKGLVAAWSTRLVQSLRIISETKEDYEKDIDYTFNECMIELTKTKNYLNYLKQLRNDNSQEQIKLSYEIAEYKDFITTLSTLNVVKTTSKRIKDDYQTVAVYQPTNKKVLDGLIIETQAKISDIQSRITKHNNNTFVDVVSYEA